MPIPGLGLLVNQGFSLAKKHQIGKKLVSWGKKGFSLNGGKNGVSLKGAGVNASFGGGGASASVGSATTGIGGLSPMVLAGIGLAAFLLLKK